MFTENHHQLSKKQIETDVKSQIYVA